MKIGIGAMKEIEQALAARGVVLSARQIFDIQSGRAVVDPEGRVRESTESWESVESRESRTGPADL